MQQQVAIMDDTDSKQQQSTMWLGTEDGCIHVYNCTDNIRTKKNKIKIQQVSAVYSILWVQLQAATQFEILWWLIAFRFFRYLDNRVFVSLANGEIIVYSRDHRTSFATKFSCLKLFHSLKSFLFQIFADTWNTTSPQTISLGSVTNPVSKLLNVHGKLWCSIQGTIKIINATTLQVENQIQIASDIKPITNMAVYNNQVWISVQNSALIKCYHSKR